MSPWRVPRDLPAPRPSTVAWEKEAARSTASIISKNLSTFWTSFNPDTFRLRTTSSQTTMTRGLTCCAGGLLHGEPMYGTRTLPTTRKRMTSRRTPKTTHNLTFQLREFIGIAKPYLTAMVMCRNISSPFELIFDKGLLRNWQPFLTNLFKKKPVSRNEIPFTMMKYVIIKSLKNKALLGSKRFYASTILLTIGVCFKILVTFMQHESQ